MSVHYTDKIRLVADHITDCWSLGTIQDELAFCYKKLYNTNDEEIKSFIDEMYERVREAD